MHAKVAHPAYAPGYGEGRAGVRGKNRLVRVRKRSGMVVVGEKMLRWRLAQCHCCRTVVGREHKEEAQV